MEEGKREYKLREGWQKISPDLAHFILADCPMMRQRTKDGKHVEELKEKIRSGKFIGGIIEIGFLNGKYMLLDGQHRLMAIHETEIPVNMSIAFFEASNEEQLIQRYSVIDTGLKKRNAVDVMQAYDLVDGIGVSRPTANLIYKASLLAQFNLSEKKKINKKDRNDANRCAELAQKWYKYGTEVLAIKDEKKPKKQLVTMLKQPYVFALAMITMKYQQTLAKKFWGNVLSPDGLSQDNPELLLHDLFLTYHGRKKNDKETTEMKFYALTAWNMFCLNKKKASLTPTERDGAKIEGTDIIVGVKI